MKTRIAILGLFFLSGATSLVYEIVWLRKLTLIFGSTQLATSTILSTFMAGLALGAFLAGRFSGRTRYEPLRIYAVLELAIGVYALCVPWLLGALSPVYRWLWNAGLSDSFLLLSLAKLVGIAVVLLPPSMLMGATLPVLARRVAEASELIGARVGTLYAINTFGAVAGTFLAGFILIPRLGVRETVWATAVVNGLLALVAWGLAMRAAPRASIVTNAAGARERKWLLAVFALSGFVALALEVCWTRVLALVTGSSVYGFTLMLLGFLIGLAGGGATFAALLRRRPRADTRALLAALLICAGFLAYATAWLFGFLPRVFAEVWFRTAGSNDWLTGASPLGPEQWMFVQLLLGLAVMFPATFALGGMFPVVLQLHSRELPTVEASVGSVYAANTVGTIAGAAAAGFLLIPAIGMVHTVTLVAAMEVALGAAVLAFAVRRGGRKRVGLLLTGLLVCALLLGGPRWDPQLMNSGVYMNLFDGDWTDWEDFSADLYLDSEVLLVEDGWSSSVLVADQPRLGNRYLAVNGKIEASTTVDLETQLLCAHLPLLIHDSPQDVLVIGLASGISAGAVTTHPVETIRVVEVERAMERAARLFSEHNRNVLDDPRVELSFNDARNDLEFASRTYDVIISEPSNPWMTVAANLFTEEFFDIARRRLRPHGVFSQWVQNYYLPTDDLRSIIGAFRKSFRYVLVFESLGGTDFLLLGSQEPFEIEPSFLGAGMESAAVAADLERIAVRNVADLGSFLRVEPHGVDRLVAGAPRNTDNNARVEFSAPWSFGRDTRWRNLDYLSGFGGPPPADTRRPSAVEKSKKGG